MAPGRNPYRGSQEAELPNQEEDITVRKQFYLEGYRITMHYAKELIGEKRYKKTLAAAKADFLANPLTDIRMWTSEGVLTIIFQPT